MTEPPRIAPFELDPTAAGGLEVVPPPAPVVPEPADRPPRRPWLRLLFGAGAALLIALLGLEAYDLLVGLFERSPPLGAGFALLIALVAAGAIGALGRELADLRRLDRAEQLREVGERLLPSEVHGQADAYIARLEHLYRGRADLAEPIARFHVQTSDALNDGEQLRLFARTVLAPLDRQGRRLVTRGARDVGALTALSPLGVLDGLIVLWRTLAMLRAIARLYGVRPGAAASIRLLRRTLGHVIAAGAGELLSDAAVEAAGASLLSVLSARAGQGAVHGLLAARLGLSALQICRPLPFVQGELPSMKQLRADLVGGDEPKPPTRAAR
ncbi:MAG: TIGR01620 family protein [Geminicoccaceae bacterium]